MSTETQTMSQQDAKQLLDQKQAVFVDIRDPDSFEVAHIPGAQHLTEDTLEEFVAKTDKNSTLVCCCYHGIASRQAAQLLAQSGFVKVFSLDGGFEEWRQNYPDAVTQA